MCSPGESVHGLMVKNALKDIPHHYYEGLAHHYYEGLGGLRECNGLEARFVATNCNFLYILILPNA